MNIIIEIIRAPICFRESKSHVEEYNRNKDKIDFKMCQCVCNVLPVTLDHAELITSLLLRSIWRC